MRCRLREAQAGIYPYAGYAMDRVLFMEVVDSVQHLLKCSELGSAFMEM
jgi:hypothetical protein